MEVVTDFHSCRGEGGDSGFADLSGEKGVEAVGVVARVFHRLVDHDGGEPVTKTDREPLDHGAHDVVVAGAPGVQFGGSGGGKEHERRAESEADPEEGKVHGFTSSGGRRQDCQARNFHVSPSFLQTAR